MVALTSMPEARINGREVAGCIFWDEQQKRLSINDSNRRSPGVSRGRCHMSAWNVTAPPQPPTAQHRETFLKLLPEIPLRIKLNTYLLSFHKFTPFLFSSSTFLIFVVHVFIFILPSSIDSRTIPPKFNLKREREEEPTNFPFSAYFSTERKRHWIGRNAGSKENDRSRGVSLGDTLTRETRSSPPSLLPDSVHLYSRIDRAYRDRPSSGRSRAISRRLPFASHSSHPVLAITNITTSIPRATKLVKRLSARLSPPVSPPMPRKL